MASPTIAVELEVNLSLIPSLAFILDDPVKGKLDTSYVLGGIGFYDVSAYFQSMTIDRGKSRQLDEYESGDAQVRFNNSDRTFDPRYTASPFYGSIVPRTPIRISVNGRYAYTGLVRDWNLLYDPGGASSAVALCSDGFTVLAQAQLAGEYNDVQLSGARIDEILSRPEVDWSATERDIDAGDTTLQQDLITEGDSALAYFREVEQTEQGQLFIAKNGYLTFRSRNDTPSIGATFSDNGGGISYQSVSVVYGTELLYNEIHLLPLGLDPVYLIDIVSQEAYGVSVLELATLHEYQADADDMASFLLTQYSQPEYRFEQVTVQMSNLSTANQNTILDLELGDLISVTFTPSGISPSITEVARVVGVEHDAEGLEYQLRLKLASLAAVPFVLSDTTLGVLDNNNLGY